MRVRGRVLRSIPTGIVLVAFLVGLGALVPAVAAELQPLWTTNIGGRIEAQPVVTEITGDGYPDVVVGSRETGAVSALDGKTGEMVWEFNAGYQIVRNLAVGDINADGKTEVVFNTRNGTLWVLDNTGKLIWRKDLSGGGELYCAPTIAEINGDGKLEILLGSKGLKKFFAFDADGNELWEAPIGAIGDNTAAVADIDGDGQPEVVMTSEDEVLYAVYAWEADGTPLWVAQVEPGDRLNAAVSIADVDADGKLDIVVGGAYEGRVYCLNAADGSRKWVFDSGERVRVSKAVVGDLNSDGKFDTVFTLRRTGIVIAVDYKGQELWRANLTGEVLHNFQPEVPALADVTGDGNPDVVIGGSDGKIYALKGSDGSIAWTYQAVNSGRFGGNQPVIVDLDGDKVAELLYGDERGNVSVLSTSGLCVDDYTSPWPYRGRTFDNVNYMPRRMPQWTVNVGGRIESPPVVADLDGDGVSEVVVGSRETGKLYAIDLSGNILWEFDAGAQIIRNPAIGDINGDGKPEIVFNARNGTMRVLDNAGKLLWSKDLSGGGELYCAPAIADINGDGKLEILVGSKGLKKFFAFDADGNELWEAPIGSIGENTAAVADIDGDGQLDVVMTSEDEVLYAIYAWKGDGTPLWVSQVEQGDRFNAAPSIADIDGDGKLEIVAGGAYEGRVYCVDGTGTRKWVFDTGERVRVSKAALGDLNGDGKLESVFTLRRTGKVYAVDYKGDVVWTADLTGEVLHGFLPEDPIIADATGDGKPDVILGGSNGRIYVLNGEDGSLAWTYQAVNAGRFTFNQPVIVDLNGDHVAEMLYGDERGNVSLLDTPGLYVDYTTTPWPLKYRTIENTNFYGIPETIFAALSLVSLACLRRLKR